MSKNQSKTIRQTVSTVVKDGQVTHVIVPLDEYERLTLASMAVESIRILEDPKTKWYSTSDVALKLAGNRIAKARKAAGMTQKALAEKVGITQSEVSRIENNPDATTVKTLRRVARALKVDVRSLIDPTRPG
jgi:DNA-binding XRE family transcriptional regulator